MVEERQRRLNNLEKDIDSIFTRAAVHVGLSDSAFDILYALEAYGGGCSQKDLCERCWMGKQTINSSIKRLCEQGILEKTAGPGRTTTISLLGHRPRAGGREGATRHRGRNGRHARVLSCRTCASA